MSGLDFLQLRPVRDAALPIVAISGVATESQARECLRLGALDFVGKPVPLDRLNEVLTFLEPHALTRRRSESAQHERRRGPRAQIGFPVRIVEYKGTGLGRRLHRAVGDRDEGPLERRCSPRARP